ncbi:MAG: hypothetical protein HOV94_41945, partial [Saccharothrix sp.]|nr:hypothetical protein [Saccharothrix sp.]
MRWFENRRQMWLVIGSLAGALVVLAAILVAVTVNRSATTAPAGSPTTVPSAPGEVTKVDVYFHRGAPDDPSRVVAVPRSVPKTQMV